LTQYCEHGSKLLAPPRTAFSFSGKEIGMGSASMVIGLGFRFVAQRAQRFSI